MIKNIFKFIIFVFVFALCGSSEIEEGLSESFVVETTEDSTQTTILVQDTTTTITTTTSLPSCTPDDNFNIDFQNVKNVQIFLNKYGFDAGDEDGYLGQQTANAIRNFQSFTGLNVDGDIGPNTIEKMKNWTGCEEKATRTSSNESNETTTTTTVVPDTTTTTVVPDTTTTTVVPANTSSEGNNYGIVPSVSLTSNDIIQLFKGVNVSDNICGTPYLNNLDSNVLNQYSNGLVSENLNILSGQWTLWSSSNTTQIVEESSSEIKIQIIGDGSEKYKFYFISPFSSNLSNVSPSSVSTSLNLTEATFNLSEFSSGVWFYSFAESGNGTVVKATGNREFSVGSTPNQQVSSHDGVGKLFITLENSSTGQFTNMSSGQGFSTNDSVNITYITDGILDNRQDTTTEIKIDDTVIKLGNEDQAYVNEILLIGSELMKVIAKDGSTLTVERGYLNTEIKSYGIGTSVKAILDLNQQNRIANFAYAVFRNESGMRFQIPIGPELTTNKFTFSNCNYDRYSLEKVVTFSWRSSGSSTLTSTTTQDKLNPLFDKVFVLNSGGQSYTPPSINASDQVSGEFLNTGPLDLVVGEGDSVVFDFSGIVDGSSKTKFARINFQLVPDTGSSKKSKTRSIYLPLNNENYNFKINIENIISTPSILNNTWEDGYKYIFDSLTLFDDTTSVQFFNNQTIKYDYSSELGTHDAYYLDQFSFIVRSN